LENNKPFQALFYHAPLGIITINEKGKIVLVNPNIEKIFGYSVDELVGKDVELLIPKHLHQNHRDHRSHYFEKPKVRPMGAGMDLLAKHKDNTEIPVEISLGHYEYSGKKFAVAFISDIQGRKKVKDELSEQNRKHQALIGNLPGIVYRCNNDMKWTMEYCSEQCQKITGYSSEELIKGSVSYGLDIILEEDRESVWNQIQAAVKNKETFDVQYRIRCQDGKIRWVMEQGDAVFDENKKIVALEGFIIDITKRKNAAEELSSSKIKFKALFEQSGGYCMILDPNIKTGIPIIVDANSDACEIHGYTRAELIGKPVGIIDNAKGKLLIKDRIALIMKGIPFQGENVHIRRNGTSLPVMVYAKRINIEGEPPLIFMTEYDITTLKKAEAELTKVKDRLLALNLSLEEKVKLRTKELTSSLEREKEMSEMKSRFVSMASHEFRTPLSSVLSSVSLIDQYREMENFEKQEKHIDRIKSAVQILTNILTDFLSVEKLEQGKVEVKPKKLNVNDFMQETIVELDGMKKEGQDINYHYEGTGEVFLDKNILRNIMMNLLSNAIKYSEKNITVAVRKKGVHITINVEDKGIGIPKDDQKNMFGNFFRAKNAANIQGTGLGLKIVKRYVDLLDGTIGFESEEGKGTTFKVQLPVKTD